MFKPVYRFFSVIIFVFIFITCLQARVKVGEGVFIDAEFRPRYEFDDRDFNNKTGFDAYGSMRSRVGLGLENLIKNTTLYLQIGDSRMLGYSNPYLTGINPGPNGFDNNFGVVQVYIDAKDVLLPGASLKIGRMSNDQGRCIIFGPGNWNMFGPRTYDGIKLGYEFNKHTLHLWTLYGLNGDRHWYPDPRDPAKSPTASENYKCDHTLTGADLWLWSKKVNFLLFLDLDQKPVDDTITGDRYVALSRTTAAVNLQWRGKNELGHWLDFDAAWQFGTMGFAFGSADISAYILAGDWSWHFDAPNFPWAGLGFQIHSGDDDVSRGDVKYFWDYYSSKHRFNGYMDYFKTPTGVKGNGLRDLIIRSGITPMENLSCKLELHHFSVTEPFPSAVDGSDADQLGMELDATAVYNIRKGLSVEFGLDFFMPSEEWQGKDGKTSIFSYLTFTAKL